MGGDDGTSLSSMERTFESCSCHCQVSWVWSTQQGNIIKLQSTFLASRLAQTHGSKKTVPGFKGQWTERLFTARPGGLFELDALTHCCRRCAF
eukprot:g30926.t1